MFVTTARHDQVADDTQHAVPGISEHPSVVESDESSVSLIIMVSTNLVPTNLVPTVKLTYTSDNWWQLYYFTYM